MGMPGKKTCPKCQASVGVRTMVCGTCKHEFYPKEPVHPVPSASVQKVEPKPVTAVAPVKVEPVSETPSTASGPARIPGKKTCPKCQTMIWIAAKVCACGHEFKKQAQAQSPVAVPTSAPAAEPAAASESAESPRPSGKALIIAPSGKPPFKPDGSADEEIVAWARKVQESNERYSVAAVTYFARYFWSINSDDWSRVKRVIATALSNGDVEGSGIGQVVEVKFEAVTALAVSQGG